MISDEIYEKIVFDGFQNISIAALGEDIQRQTVVINGASKCFAMTGWRIGYFAADPAIASAVTKLQGQSTSNPASVSQAAAVEALIGKDTPKAVESMVAEFKTRRDYLMGRYEKIPGIR